MWKTLRKEFVYYYFFYLIPIKVLLLIISGIVFFPLELMNDLLIVIVCFQLTKKIENAEKNSKAIERWIKDVSELHLSKPAPTVAYTRYVTTYLFNNNEVSIQIRLLNGAFFEFHK